MRYGTLAISTCVVSLLVSLSATAQTDPNPALTAPDQLAWKMFIAVNAAAVGTNATFETWASDTDTFSINPVFPTAPTSLVLRRPVIPTLGRQAIQESGGLLPAVPPNPSVSLEETRRNKSAFEFIVRNNLYKISGLRAAYGKVLSFPVDAVEVKANWVSVEQIPAFTLNRVGAADIAKEFHVNRASDGKQYALVSMHIITKQVPNWTWATFENEMNPARCDIIGCKDSFGSQPTLVAPNAQAAQGYAACGKTPALKALFAAAHWDTAFTHYCLKGSQADFVDNTGLDIRLGNSVTEDGFVTQSSCMTCHGRAAFDRNGKETTTAGFDAHGAPLGPIQPTWYWAFTSQPPIFVGMQGLAQIATSADFVWSIPFCAVDDTVNPPALNRNCVGK